MSTEPIELSVPGGEWHPFREFVERFHVPGYVEWRVAPGWRLVRPSNDDPHYVTFSEDGWAIEHSAACRNAGSMLGCEIHALMSEFPAVPEWGHGRYLVDLRAGGVVFSPEVRRRPKAMLIEEEWKP